MIIPLKGGNNSLSASFGSDNSARRNDGDLFSNNVDNSSLSFRPDNSGERENSGSGNPAIPTNSSSANLKYDQQDLSNFNPIDYARQKIAERERAKQELREQQRQQRNAYQQVAGTPARFGNPPQPGVLDDYNMSSTRKVEQVKQVIGQIGEVKGIINAQQELDEATVRSITESIIPMLNNLSQQRINAAKETVKELNAQLKELNDDPDADPEEIKKLTQQLQLRPAESRHKIHGQRRKHAIRKQIPPRKSGISGISGNPESPATPSHPSARQPKITLNPSDLARYNSCSALFVRCHFPTQEINIVDYQIVRC